ncbi:MAG: serine/threonine protein kinase [Planctomycetes bacterium]|nr:serine/threonine protein kinase [Planctomycetota bacterium]
MAESSPPTTEAENTDSLLARTVVDQGLATAEDVEACRQTLTGDAAGTTLATALVSRGIVTAKQLERIKAAIEPQKTAQQIPGYQILEKLGAGAMATVFKARQMSLDRMVAIKVLPRKHTNNPQFVQRFYAEGRAAAKLNHPNIVAAYDVGKAGEFHYFVMEYVQGRTVFDDISKNQRYSEREALHIVLQIARALEHAHKAGFIHRDVKPKNIMITKEGTAKLADMGLARAVSDREAAEAEAGKAFGTPYYISPEQIRGEIDIDFRADIYGLGATFYHMVTGQVPYDGPNPSAVMHKHLKAELVPPDHINPTLSSGIGEIIEVCMAKNRKQRYTSTSDLLHDLEAVAKGEAPVQARKKFDFAALENMEREAPDAAVSADSNPGVITAGSPLTSQPLFWLAVGGWAAALLLLVLLLFSLVK